MTKIQLETTEPEEVLREIFGEAPHKRGETEIKTQNYSLKFEGETIRLAEGFPPIINLTIVFFTSVAGSLFANWLWEKIKNREIKSLKINGKQVELNLESIRYNLKT